MNTSALEEKYMNFLKEEGYKPKIIEGYGIVFQYKGDNYSLEFDKTQSSIYKPPNHLSLLTVN
jgi:hypothetical protein